MARKSNQKRKRVESDSEDESTLPASSAASVADTSTPEPQPAKKSKPSAEEKFNDRFEPEKNSKEVILEMQQKTWSAECYRHYKSPPNIIIDADGKVKYQFVCKKYPSKVVTRARHDVSTSNLKNHADSCSPPKDSKQGTLDKDVAGANYSSAKFRLKILEWIVRRHRPYAIVNDPELREAFEMLYGLAEVPSARTISRDVQEVFELSKREVSRVLQEYPGKFHVGIDGWTAPHVISFLGVVLYFVREAKMTSLVLDFVKLSESHTGRYLSERLVDCLREFGIEKKILGVVCDNASNNDTLVSELEIALGGQNGSRTRIRCFAHILNLAVKAVLSVFTRGADDDNDNADMSNELYDLEDDEEEEEEVEAEEGRERSDNKEIDTIINGADNEVGVTSAQLAVGRSALSKLRKITKRVCHSSTLTDDLLKLCAQLNIKPKKLLRPVATRWNSVAEASARAIEIRAAVDKLVDLNVHNTRNTRLRHLKLTELEWTVLEDLQGVLEDFLIATRQISESGIPLMHKVIPIMDFLTTKLDESLVDTTLNIAVRAGVSRGLALINKYYAKTDESIMYRMAMMLHPQYKTAYFSEQEWPNEWISTARGLLRDEWNEYYKPDVPTSSRAPAPAPTLSSKAEQFAALGRRRMVAPKGTELEAYIREEPILSEFTDDPIKYWHAKQVDPFARMALDFVSAPATSVDVERAFSRGSLTVSKHRHALSDKSTRAAVVLRSWMEAGLVNNSEIIKVFEDKARRAKEGSLGGSSVEDSIVVD